MSYDVDLTLDAMTDLRGIANYIAQNNAERAVSFITDLEIRLTNILSVMPNSGNIHKEETRFFMLSGYVALYDVNEQKKIVNILRIVNSRTNWKVDPPST